VITDETLDAKILDTLWFTAVYPLAVCVVAVCGDRGDDWAAYVGALLAEIPEQVGARLIAEEGAKLPEPVARAYFPAVDLEYRP